MAYRLVAISGEVCSGKSTVAERLLAEMPGWHRVNTGQRFREFCAARGVSIQQVSLLPDEVHRDFDAAQLHLLQTAAQTIVEGRLAGWLARDLPDVLRIFCYADLGVRTERYMRRERVSRAAAVTEIEYRDRGDAEKYARLYEVEDYGDPRYYHVRLDTSAAAPASLAARVLELLAA